MKKQFLCILLLLLIILLTFTACTPNHTPQKFYYFNVDHTLGSLQLRIDNDTENERFVVTHKKLADNAESNIFYFIFTHHTIEKIKNSEEFTYFDDLGNDIVFDENGHYEFYGDKIIYVSYANANEDIKNSITNNEYSIDLFYTFVPNPYI